MMKQIKHTLRCCLIKHRLCCNTKAACQGVSFAPPKTPLKGGEFMRTRKNRIVFCLDDKELEKLKKKVKKSGMSMSAFLRKLCDEKEIKELPDVDFKEVISQLRRIGINIQQIALKAHTLGFIDAPLYRRNHEDLQVQIGKIMEVIY